MNSKTEKISVREIKKEDFLLIADYWLKSDPDFLVKMGVDLKKLPNRSNLIQMLTGQIQLPLKEKQSYALIWELNGIPIGHSNVNEIEYGNKAKMHLHLWLSDSRKKGLGTALIKKSLSLYFERLELKLLICEPFALNPAPNKTLAKVGFEFKKKYLTIPGALNFEQEVNQWILSKENYLKMLK